MLGFTPIIEFPRKSRKTVEAIDIITFIFGGNFDPLYINIFSADPIRNYKQFLSRGRI